MFKNAYMLLRELLPDAPLQVGTVLSVDGGVADIEMPGGGRAQARGQTGTGARVFFRGGVIEGPAPDLPVEIIEI
ncbi:MAG: hypothetical protein I8H71_00450 [Xanthomonadaceae bacterium]|nr:hypothetical protein [Xanthomonadaceae bacterium]MBH2008143.1 hypothetical protein [Xanthomonadaceae bacterium]